MLKGFLLYLLLSLNCSFLISQEYFSFFPEENALHQYVGGLYGGGISFADFDKDGWDDISIPGNGIDPVFLKNENGTLQLVEPFFSNGGELKQITWVDYDNDGDRDVFSTGISIPIGLYRNDGDAGFVNVTVEAGFTTELEMMAGNSWGDYDRDGYLDVFVSVYDAAYAGLVDGDNKLFRNNGDGTFTDVAALAGLYFEINYTFMALWFDYNNDLWPDLLITNDRNTSPNYLFHNNGDGTFTDISITAGISDAILAMSATADDYDNDGDLDIYISNGSAGNLHKRNNGDGTFTEVAEELGTQMNYFCWSSQFLDADNDMWQDLHVCTTPHTNIPGENRFMKNTAGSFSHYEMESGFDEDLGWSRGSAVGDFNNDGFADLAVSKSSPNYTTFWQAIPGENNWMKIELEGVQSNKDGVSSWIELYCGGMKQVRYTYCGESYLAQNSFTEFFGMGDNSIADSVIVRWNSGIVDKWTNIPAGQFLHLVEGNGVSVTLDVIGDLNNCATDSVAVISGPWFHYLWNNGEADSVLFVGISTDVSLLATDQWGNDFLSDTLYLNFAEPPEVSVSIFPPTCAGATDAEVTLSGTFNSDDAIINWNDGAFGGAQLISIPAGQYAYHVQLPNDCFAEGIVVVEEPLPLQSTLVVSDVTCHGLNDGQVSAEFTGGTPPYTVTWQTGEPSALEAGTHTMVVVDGNGCSQSNAFTVNEPSPIAADIQVTNVSCNGDSTGSVTFNAVGGTGELQLIFIEDNSDALYAGDYEVTITDESGCTSIFPFTVAEPDPIEILLSVSPQIGTEANGSALAIVSGGFPPFTLDWGNGPETEFQASELLAGTYEVVVTDSMGCTTSTGFTIDFIDAVNASLLSHFKVFPNPTDDFITIETVGSNLPDHFRLLDIDGGVVQELHYCGSKCSIDVFELSSGAYILEINMNGETAHVSVFIR